MVLKEKQILEVLMIFGYNDRKRCMAEVCVIFNKERSRTNKQMVSKILQKFNETGNVNGMQVGGSRKHLPI